MSDGGNGPKWDLGGHGRAGLSWCGRDGFGRAARCGLEPGAEPRFGWGDPVGEKAEMAQEGQEGAGIEPAVTRPGLKTSEPRAQQFSCLSFSHMWRLQALEEGAGDSDSGRELSLSRLAGDAHEGKKRLFFTR